MVRGYGRYNRMDAETAKWIIGGLVVAVLGLSSYIVKLHLDNKALWQARVEDLQAQIDTLTGEDE